MYCKQCGNEMLDNAAICMKCGVAKGVGNSYCPNCGIAVENADAAVCTNCGASLKAEVYGEKSKLVAGVLGILVGGLGIHNFYLGYTGKAIAQLLISVLTCGFGATVSSIWGLIEGILILTGSINTDAEGNLLKD